MSALSLADFRKRIVYSFISTLIPFVCPENSGAYILSIHNWSKDGILKAYKIGIRLRFKRADIEQTLLSSNKKASE
ncbi:hypothetical protein ACKGJN_06825 [Gillisia sp. Q332]|uniref:hypothetical protein n=1 Tax=Gillisia xinjiangensis TaxID=3384765 RepID=UPI00391DBC17